MSDTDKTAEAVLAWNHAIDESVDTSEIGCVIVCDEAVGGHVTTWLLADLRRMAKLWLMRRLIQKVADIPFGRSYDEDEDAITDLREQLKALEMNKMQSMTFCKHAFQDGINCPVCKGVPQFSDKGAIASIHPPLQEDIEALEDNDE